MFCFKFNLSLFASCAIKIHLTALLSLLVITSPVCAQEPLVLSKPDDPIAEVSSKVLREAYQRIGIQIQMKTLPAERGLVQSNQGMIDGEVNRIQGIESTYSNLIMVPVAINTFEGVVFTKKVTFPVTGWDSLRPYNIGVRIGTKFAEQGTEGMNVESVTTNEQLLLKLYAGRNDVIVTSRIEGLGQIKRLQLKGVKVIEPPLVTEKLYHYLHKKHAAMIPGIAKVLREMAAEGRIQAIQEQAIAELLQ